MFRKSALTILCALGGTSALAFTAPLQPWSSPDGAVRLLRPAIARPDVAPPPVGSLMAPGWRLLWDGAAPTPGRIVVRFALPVAPASGIGTSTEYLQIGASRDRASVRSCLRYGLAGGAGRHLPDRVINGVRFAVWANGDAGMSQQITATDLRAVVGGTCYAVARFGYAVSATDRDPSVTLSQAAGDRLLDQALASLHLGAPGRYPPLQPPSIKLPKGVVAR